MPQLTNSETAVAVSVSVSFIAVHDRPSPFDLPAGNAIRTGLNASERGWIML